MLRAGKKQRWFPDKNGILLKYNDLVWVSVYHYQLKIVPSQHVLGRFLSEDDNWDSSSLMRRLLKIQIGDNIFSYCYHSDELEKATPDCEELYENQISEFNSILMLEKSQTAYF